MFKGIIIGDAYGAGFEFCNSMLKYNNAERFYNHPTHMASDGSENSLRAGQYTDDTQMSIAVAKTLLSGDLSKESFTKSFIDTFNNDQRKGYAKGFYEFLTKNKTVDSFLLNIRPDSEKNGAAMRSVPLGVLSTPEDVMAAAELQASITHNTQVGKDSSKIVGLAAYYLLRSDNKDGLISFIEDRIPGYDLSSEWNRRVPCHGIATAKAALTVVMSTNSLKEAMIRSVAFGGDTDSVASIAVGLLDCYKNKINDIPENLISTCEQGSYGLDYCLNLEKELFEKYSIGDKKKKHFSFSLFDIEDDDFTINIFDDCNLHHFVISFDIEELEADQEHNQVLSEEYGICDSITKNEDSENEFSVCKDDFSTREDVINYLESMGGIYEE